MDNVKNRDIAKDVTYIADILRFTERQIKIHTGIELRLSAASYVLPETIHPGMICEEVADELELTFDDLKGKKRNREVVVARLAASHLLRRYYPRIKLTDIAELLNKDHTSIMYFLSRADQLLVTKEEWFYEKYQSIEQRIEKLAMVVQEGVIPEKC